ncbi:hypothetical protein [Roseomonas sp. KE0001]|uniref:hypothetical protein n=1 Tax=Roseomonas sp. KE0001 TaxID=2479201 RepID=UPI0018DEEF90|nr:hypothetical protein [Roseomonas sp. KE0001]MBI0434238.1 hypothetical protein [Roseomonas sp. KE0001]
MSPVHPPVPPPVVPQIPDLAGQAGRLDFTYRLPGWPGGAAPDAILASAEAMRLDLAGIPLQSPTQSPSPCGLAGLLEAMTRSGMTGSLTRLGVP